MKDKKNDALSGVFPKFKLKDLIPITLSLTFILTICTLTYIFAFSTTKTQNICAVLMLVICAINAYFICHHLDKKDDSDSVLFRGDNVVLKSYYAVVIVLILFIIIYQTGYINQKVYDYLLNDYKSERNHFINDSNRYPYLKKFAKDNFGIQVGVSDEKSGFTYNKFLLFKGNSPAVMQSFYKYCLVSFSEQRVLSEFPETKHPDLWLKGIMMHEFGHCVDNSRDKLDFIKNDLEIHTISPKLLAKFKLENHNRPLELQDFIELSSMPESALRGEVFADVFSVGYWKLSAPGEAKYLTIKLFNKREENKKNDPMHATSCWIRAAHAQPAPASYSAITAWADAIMDKPCHSYEP